MSARVIDGLNQNLNRLYDETQVHVTGPVSKNHKGYLGRMYKRAGASIKKAMGNVGLYPVEYETESLHAYPIHPDNGLIGGFANGESISINPYHVPGTSYYRSLKKWLGSKRGDLANYLYNKFAVDENAEEMANYIMLHEALHNYTQLRPLKTAGKKSKKEFARYVLDNLTDRYEKNLPGNWKWIAPLLARFSYKPIIEGINEVATENVRDGKSAFIINKQRQDMPTTYDSFAAASAYALDKGGIGKPGEEALSLYREFADGNFKAVDRYMDLFFEYRMGDAQPLADKRSKPFPTAVACAYRPSSMVA